MESGGFWLLLIISIGIYSMFNSRQNEIKSHLEDIEDMVQILQHEFDESKSKLEELNESMDEVKDKLNIY